MSTYELPPEPPVGLHQKYTVTRNDGRDRPGARYFVINYAADPAAMAALAAYADAVESDNPKLAADLRTLIEPDPWPTEPLIVAEGRLWFRQEDGDYLDKDGTVRGEGRHTFAGPVVPVTVVPTAPLPVLWSALEQWLNGHSDPDAATNKLVGTVVGLREQIDALGLDQ